jgi:hypothetical protein
MVYGKDHLNKVPKAVIAEHMGYKGLSGASLPILAALNQYGLLEGRSDETRVSQRALNIIVHEPGSSSDRLTAMREAAFLPEVFSELVDRFRGGNPSDAAIRAHLLAARFIPAAADTVVRSYRETIGLLDSEEDAYKRANPIQAEMVEMDARMDEANERGELLFPAKAPASRTKSALVAPSDSVNEALRVGIRREVFALTEGDVVLSFPSNLSHDSYADLEAYLQIFLRRAKRMAAYSNVGPDADRWHEALTKPKDDSAT